jgi:hypothetical protein
MLVIEEVGRDEFVLTGDEPERAVLGRQAHAHGWFAEEVRRVFLHGARFGDGTRRALHTFASGSGMTLVDRRHLADAVRTVLDALALMDAADALLPVGDGLDQITEQVLISQVAYALREAEKRLRVPARRTSEEDRHAIQEREATPVHVGEPPEDSEAVGTRGEAGA